eukprot:COSAG05_NODE_604_length_8399_cov_6.936145_9_plen_94_part_00
MASDDTWRELATTVPTGAGLTGELKLATVDAMVDATRDGGVRLKPLVEGEGWRKPSELDEVVVTYEFRDVNSAEIVSTLLSRTVHIFHLTDFI